MSLRYDLRLDDLAEFLSSSQKIGFTEEAILAAEGRIGVSLPESCRRYLQSYGAEEMNYRHHLLCPPEKIMTSYQKIDRLLTENTQVLWDSQDDRSSPKDDHIYQNIAHLPVEQWPALINNYVLLWYDNQGTWCAGYLWNDLLQNHLNPPVYVGSCEDLTSFQQSALHTEAFLFSFLWDSARTCNSRQYSHPLEISYLLSINQISQKQLQAAQSCLDPIQKKLYLYWSNGQDTELILVQKDAKDSFILPEERIASPAEDAAFFMYLPTTEEILSHVPPTPYERNPSCGIFTTGNLPHGLESSYIHTILTEDTRNILRFLAFGHPNTAVQKLHACMDKNHADSTLYTLVAYCYYYFSYYEQTYWNLYKALDYDPDNILLLRARCLIVAINTKSHMHIKDLTKLLQLDPVYTDVYLLSRAFYYFYNQKNSSLCLDAAYADLKQLMQRGFPADNDSRINEDGFPDDFRRFYAKVKQKASETGAIHWRKSIEGLSALEEARELCRAQYSAIFAMLQKEAYQNAIAACTKEIEKAPDCCNLYLIRAYCYHHYDAWSATPKKIADDLNQALQLEPDNLIALRSRAFMPTLSYGNKERCLQQIADLTKLMEIDTQYYDIYLYHRSFLHYGLKNFVLCLIDLNAYAQLSQAHCIHAQEALRVMRYNISEQEFDHITKIHHLLALKA